MTEAILAPSELDVMAGLLQYLAEGFNGDGGIAAVAVQVEELGSFLRLHRGESACELVAYWLEKQSCRLPLD